MTYADAIPVRVSCKLKTAAQLRAVYGAGAAGAQHGCPDMTRALQAQAVETLRRTERAAAAEVAAGFVVDEDPPYVTGSSFLASYPLSERGADGRVHLRSIGLFQDYDRWYTALLPKFLQGQSYCHLPTVEYLVALASGAMAPGTIVTTDDTARVRPQ
ncbi:MAG: hypothetical protein U1F11_05505 [Steroidobacteraceae bacterium]